MAKSRSTDETDLSKSGGTDRPLSEALPQGGVASGPGNDGPASGEGAGGIGVTPTEEFCRGVNWEEGMSLADVLTLLVRVRTQLPGMTIQRNTSHEERADLAKDLTHEISSVLRRFYIIEEEGDEDVCTSS